MRALSNSHSATDPSTPPVAIVVPSGDTQRHVTSLVPRKERTSLPEAACVSDRSSNPNDQASKQGGGNRGRYHRIHEKRASTHAIIPPSKGQHINGMERIGALVNEPEGVPRERIGWVGGMGGMECLAHPSLNNRPVDRLMTHRHPKA